MKRIFVSGTFDLIHPGHLKLLNFAKSCGDYLLVAIDDDARVSSLKGDTRPINCLYNRISVIQNFRAVDEVVSFGSDQELINLIKEYKPHAIIVGSDYKDKTVIGSNFADNVIFFERIEQYSSTKIIESIINQ